MDENNNNVNETENTNNRITPESGKNDSGKSISAFEMPEDNRTKAPSEQKADSTPVPAYYPSSGSTTGSSEKNSETTTYNSYNNVVSEPAEFSTGFAITSLVMGILSILTSCCCGLGILMSILGIIFGCVQPKDEFNKKPSMAVVGIITSIIGILTGILIIILFGITGLFA